MGRKADAVPLIPIHIVEEKVDDRALGGEAHVRADVTDRCLDGVHKVAHVA